MRSERLARSAGPPAPHSAPSSPPRAPPADAVYDEGDATVKKTIAEAMTKSREGGGGSSGVDDAYKPPSFGGSGGGGWGGGERGLGGGMDDFDGADSL